MLRPLQMLLSREPLNIIKESCVRIKQSQVHKIRQYLSRFHPCASAQASFLISFFFAFMVTWIGAVGKEQEGLESDCNPILFISQRNENLQDRIALLWSEAGLYITRLLPGKARAASRFANWRRGIDNW